MKFKKLSMLVLFPLAALLAVWFSGNIWFDSRSRAITHSWAKRDYKPILEATHSLKWVVSQIPNSVSKTLSDKIAQLLTTYSTDDTDSIYQMQSPEEIETELMLDTPPYNRMRIAMGQLDLLGSQEGAIRLSETWDAMWMRWASDKRQDFRARKMARIIGVDINSINVKMITNTFETLPLDILQNNEHPSFTKFQAPFRIHSQGSAAESSSETQWVDVSMFIKTTRRCYPIAFRLVHFNKLERWYLTEITTAFMYGQSMDDYYLL